MLNIKNITYSDFKTKVASENSNWAVISSINFEECSTFFVKDLIAALNISDSKRVKFYPIRLSSMRSSPWSALGVVKEMFSKELINLAQVKKIEFTIKEFEYPIGADIVYDVLLEARYLFREKANLVIDLSAMPREMAAHFSDKICDMNRAVIMKDFLNVFIIFTPPERITSRNGLGPFSVGRPKFVFNQGLTNILTSKHKTNLLVFPGYEGFEAKSVIDTFAGHNTNIVCAMSCFNNSFTEDMNLLIGNQAIIKDEVNNNNINIRYYFTCYDILRVAVDFLKNSLKLFEEFPNSDHALITAPFGPKAAIFISSYIGNLYIKECAKINPDKEVITDIITLPTSQYVSLYSRGNNTPEVFNIISKINDI